MDYNEQKLKGFKEYLSKLEPELLERVSPLGITNEGLLSSLSVHKSSQEDWTKVLEYWDGYAL